MSLISNLGRTLMRGSRRTQFVDKRKMSSEAAPPASDASKIWLPRLLSGLGVFCFTGSIVYLGRPREEVLPSSPEEEKDVADGNVILLQPDQYNDHNVFARYLLRTRDRLHDVWHDAGSHTDETLLPAQLPGMYRPSDFTLVVDLEDTLVTSVWDARSGWRVIKRPGVDEFLEYCANLFGEVVVFSDNQVMDSVGIIDKLDPKQLVLYRLYKGHMVASGGKQYKDLSLLNRDLKKVLIIDDKPERFSLQPNNGIKIKPFNGDPNDTALLEMISFLQAIVQADVADVRDVIKRFKDTDDVARAFLERRRQKQYATPNVATPGLATPGSAAVAGGAVPPPTQQQQPQEQSWVSKLIWGSQ